MTAIEKQAEPVGWIIFPRGDFLFNMPEVKKLSSEISIKIPIYAHPPNIAAAAEREACAKLCEETEPFYGAMFAKAIRARGKE